MERLLSVVSGSEPSGWIGLDWIWWWKYEREREESGAVQCNAVQSRE